MVNFIFSLLVAFVFVALCWLTWGYITPSDSFANGNKWAILSLVASGIIGLIIGYWVIHNIFRIIIVVLVILIAGFWFFAPESWWAKSSKELKNVSKIVS